WDAIIVGCLSVLYALYCMLGNLYAENPIKGIERNGVGVYKLSKNEFFRVRTTSNSVRWRFIIQYKLISFYR
ncbi:MAG: hypothetical protein NDF56_08085, partial [archaeon GB-1845-036]|nr:hypothetical protein [Candidatus Culexmicrobium thermophilum]